MSHVGKIMMVVILDRSKSQVEPFIAEELAGFRKDRSTGQYILILRLVAEKAVEKGQNCIIAL